MITRFGTLYAGHVDLEDLGYDATPVNDRWLPDETLASVFGKALVTESLMELQDRNPGLQEVNVGAAVMSMERPVILEQLESFGKEVMPTFKKQLE